VARPARLWHARPRWGLAEVGRMGAGGPLLPPAGVLTGPIHAVTFLPEMFQ
jgi:hypothetical protein